MKPLPVIAIFDVGKTNKKLFLFNEQYKVVYEKSISLNETIDEDGESCEDINALREFVLTSLKEILSNADYNVIAVNFSTYGASFVYINNEGKPLTPLYNYLKKYPEELYRRFYNAHGSEEKISLETASPVLKSLNSGLQIYRLKYLNPGIFAQVAFALHLPQYVSYLVHNYPATDMTSIGCHTALWNFKLQDYHHWVKQEGIDKKFAPVIPSSASVPIRIGNKEIKVGIGLHDSSAALIPYLLNFKEPFVLISTGTWNITLNPFNKTPLTDSELRNDCLCYMSYKGIPVKASRLFAGFEHDEQVKLIASHFHKSPQFYKQVSYEPSIINNSKNISDTLPDPALFKSFEEAYHHLIFNLVKKQSVSSGYIMTKNVKNIFVDGGFSQNTVFMNLLASFYSGKEVYAATVAQSTALGAALAVHDKWNTNSMPSDLINLKYYTPDFKII